MHSMRIPYPIEEKQMYYVNDFYVLHLAYLNPYRVQGKSVFYQWIDWEMNHRHAVTLSRMYSNSVIDLEKLKKHTLTSVMVDFEGFDFWQSIDTSSKLSWYYEYILEHITHHNVNEFRNLDIFTNEFIALYGSDPRPIYIKLLHKYLHLTQKFSSNIVVRVLDKIVKKLTIWRPYRNTKK